MRGVMATIFSRHNKDGSTTWRMQIRRKDMKPFITSFLTKEAAEEFVKTYEELYVMNPEEFDWDHLRQIRMNEFARKELKE
jgi:hypothetical protein